ncbi:putative defensin-like protein 251 [Arabidopsis thaliana]|uniref:Putative defensin-like protein 251 n=4 Tax=Arabidopsis TaxID=3701 RepID=DF251_ARATH|nr:SCR-like 12 [Arabidopsis thaliana]P82631.1 RecName: Full=Putative defensin-like protein 251; AltName: Full=Putative S locus cysteine-rich-like protein 12; Short=Protein SCRL12; Short=SCR-like protein 12; Flags: Precursor [Arabidopsis thaliana]KAG7626349.1 hypothetical protein ISN45_At03g025090 [Arabidopsis thaliana x Arabidopsis arenosa]KAG7632333.1 hypothetical protein ISN44_As03g024810 [Arabidopsis suecica]AEE76806.1 SCR-like 12 [Arabidopsis thaliana]OAP04509.1 SCRL12 [Arabidopsis thalian|eukprot:NP_001030752.1 SCR-like 12 [Arabidopsis thaliana]
MRCVTSFVVFCILMFFVLNIFTVEVKAQRLVPLCKTIGYENPGKCPADGNKFCRRKLDDRYVKYKRCDCQDTKGRKQNHHRCICYMKLPCNQ